MFSVVILTDTVRVVPQNFDTEQQQALEDELNRKYSNKVLHKVGLCIRVFDLLETSDPIVHACQDGSYQSEGKPS